MKSIGAQTVEEHEASRSSSEQSATTEQSTTTEQASSTEQASQAEQQVQTTQSEQQVTTTTSTEQEQSVTTTSTEQQATNEVNWGELTNNVFKSKEEFDQGIARFGQLNAELTRFRTMDNSSVFASEKLSKLNAFAKNTGIDDLGVYDRVSSITDHKALSPEEKIALAEVLEYPNLNSRYSDIIEETRKKYGINAEKYLEADENYKPIYSELDLLRSSQAAEKKISEFYGKMSAEDQTANPEEEVQGFLARREAWGKAPGAMSSQTYKSQLPDGAEGSLSYDLPPEDVQAAATEVSGLFADAGFDTSDQNIQRFGAIVELVALGRAAKAGKLSTSFRGKFLADAKEQADGKFHNSKPIDSERKPDEGVPAETLQDENFKKAMQELS